MRSGAELSPDGRFRYSLWREWSGARWMAFVMLNPSTADANVDDPTIRRCIGFAKREGCGGIEVVNLYPFRATKPADLIAAVRAGERVYDGRSLIVIRDTLQWALEHGVDVVAAWGAHAPGKWLETGLVQNDPSWSLLQAEGRVKSLGVTRSGAPRHPLFVGAFEPLVRWPPVEVAS